MIRSCLKAQNQMYNLSGLVEQCQKLSGAITVGTRMKQTRRQMMAHGVPLDRGEYAINVQWYNQRDIGSLEYCIEREYTHPIVNHNRTLILGGFQMIQSAGSLGRVPRQRNIRDRNDENGYTAPQLNLQTRGGDWYQSEFANVYVLAENIRDEGLAWCGIWGSRR